MVLRFVRLTVHGEQSLSQAVWKHTVHSGSMGSGTNTVTVAPSAHAERDHSCLS